MKIYAGFRPQPAHGSFPGPAAALDRHHTDQVIIIVSLVLGFWLIGKSLYYLVT